MPAGYDDPGPEPVDAVKDIVLGLREALKDPYSARDLAICQSHVQPPERPLWKGDTWKRAYRITLFQVRAKNGFGAYDGLSDGIATFRDGKFTKLTTYRTVTGTGPDIERAIAWRGSCRRIPDSDVQAMMQE